jgi:hypothetical protein
VTLKPPQAEPGTAVATLVQSSCQFRSFQRTEWYALGIKRHRKGDDSENLKKKDLELFNPTWTGNHSFILSWFSNDHQKPIVWYFSENCSIPELFLFSFFSPNRSLHTAAYSWAFPRASTKQNCGEKP